MEELRAQLRAMLARQIELPEAEIADDLDVMDALGADSLDMVEFLTAVEERYQIHVSDEEALEWKTVDAMAADLSKRGVKA